LRYEFLRVVREFFSECTRTSMEVGFVEHD
jgi:hypothetical protein